MSAGSKRRALAVTHLGRDHALDDGFTVGFLDRAQLGGSNIDDAHGSWGIASN
jgi:hypothetical protein